jgi:hypothetical protein
MSRSVPAAQPSADAALFRRPSLVAIAHSRVVCVCFTVRLLTARATPCHVTLGGSHPYSSTWQPLQAAMAALRSFHARSAGDKDRRRGGALRQLWAAMGPSEVLARMDLNHGGPA